MRVLIVCPHYTPGYRSGGPVRSVSCLIESLGDTIEFLVLTHCHDAKVKEPYPEIPVRQWVALGKAKVMYVEDADFHPWRLLKHIEEARPDAMFLNSFFHRMATLNFLLLKRLGMLRHVRVAVAPRGELAPGALALKGARKRLFIALARRVGLYHGVFWVASSEFEKQEVLAAMGGTLPVAVFHIPPTWEELSLRLGQPTSNVEKNMGEAHFAFVGKITPKKNLDFAIERLRSLRGDVRFSVVGRFSDPYFERTIRNQVRSLPENVWVEFLGQTTPEEAIAVLSRCHLHVFPSRGENFGHVIVESLAAGCPVLLSDKTPWRDLEGEGVGWDIPLDQPVAFEEALQRILDLDSRQWSALSKKAREFAKRICSSEEPKRSAEAFFRELCGSSVPTDSPSKEVQAITHP